MGNIVNFSKESAMKKLKLFLILFLFHSTSVWALTPPLSPDALKENADLIVEGKIDMPVKCLKKTESNKCFDQFDYKTTLKISAVLKGTAKVGEKISVEFYHNDYSKSNCVGDQGATLHTGDEGTFYLKKNGEGFYTPLHWSAVILKTKGNGAWEKCK